MNSRENISQEQIKEKLDLLKAEISRFFDIDGAFTEISGPVSGNKGTTFIIEIKFEVPENKLRSFHLTTYSFSIDKPDKIGFKYESRFYRYDNLLPFLKKISEEMNVM